MKISGQELKKLGCEKSFNADICLRRIIKDKSLFMLFLYLSGLKKLPKN